MTEETLETAISDGSYGRLDGRITVEIRASGEREDEFNAVRDAVMEVLGDG